MLKPRLVVDRDPRGLELLGRREPLLPGVRERDLAGEFFADGGDVDAADSELAAAGLHGVGLAGLVAADGLDAGGTAGLCLAAGADQAGELGAEDHARPILPRDTIARSSTASCSATGITSVATRRALSQSLWRPVACPHASQTWMIQRPVLGASTLAVRVPTVVPPARC
jgi:hypothetical protein